MSDLRDACMNVDEVIDRLLAIDKPESHVLTEVDLNGDIIIGMYVRSVRYDGFHNRVVITGRMDEQQYRELREKRNVFNSRT